MVSPLFPPNPVSSWREIGFGCTYYYVLGVPYSCGVVLVFLVLAGNSFWCFVRTQCTIQLCGCVNFVVVAGKLLSVQCTVVLLCQFFGCSGKQSGRKKKFQSSVWRVRNRYSDRKKKFQPSVWWVRNLYYNRKKNSSSIVLVLRTYLVYNVQLCCCVSFLVVEGNSLYQFNLN